MLCVRCVVCMPLRGEGVPPLRRAGILPAPLKRVLQIKGCRVGLDPPISL